MPVTSRSSTASPWRPNLLGSEKHDFFTVYYSRLDFFCSRILTIWVLLQIEKNKIILFSWKTRMLITIHPSDLEHYSGKACFCTMVQKTWIFVGHNFQSLTFFSSEGRKLFAREVHPSHTVDEIRERNCCMHPAIIRRFLGPLKSSQKFENWRKWRVHKKQVLNFYVIREGSNFGTLFFGKWCKFEISDNIESLQKNRAISRQHCLKLFRVQSERRKLFQVTSPSLGCDCVIDLKSASKNPVGKPSTLSN